MRLLVLSSNTYPDTFEVGMKELVSSMKQIYIEFKRTTGLIQIGDFLDSYSQVFDSGFEDLPNNQHIKEFNKLNTHYKWVKILNQYDVETIIDDILQHDIVEFSSPVYYDPENPLPVGFTFKNRIILCLEENQDISDMEALLEDLDLEFIQNIFESMSVFKYPIEIKDPSYIVISLEESQYVKFAELALVQLNYVSASVPPNDEKYNEQWYLQQINIEDAWLVTRGSPLTIIAVIDSGFDLEHVDLKQKYVPEEKWYNALSPGDPPYPGGSSLSQPEHGTRVAGIAAADTNSVNDVGIASVGYNCSILPIKLWEGPTLELENLLMSLSKAREEKAKVINMSFLWDSMDGSLDTAIANCESDGIVLVAAAGNSPPPPPPHHLHELAKHDKVMAVGATDKNDCRWVHQATQLGSVIIDGISVVAPGEDILTTDYTPTHNGCCSFQATSAATPQVAGLAALVLSYNPTLSATEVKTLIETTADKTIDPAYAGDDWKKRYGNGRIDAGKCLKKLEMDHPFTPFDVFVRDYINDTGIVPSTEPVICRSPDIVIKSHGASRPSELDNKDLDPGSVAVTPGNTYDVYLRVHNKTDSDTDVHARVYCAPLTTSCSPDLWIDLGQLYIYDVPANGFKASEPLIWTNVPAPSHATEHFCLIASIEGYGDPHPDTSGIDTAAAYLDFIRNNNNVCYRNLVIVQATPDEPVPLTFIVKGFPMGANNYDLRLLQRVHGNIQAAFYDNKKKKILPNNEGFEPYIDRGSKHRVIRESAIELDENEIRSYKLVLLAESQIDVKIPLVIQQIYEGEVIGSIIVEVDVVPRE